jgi:NTP pyrophosphatase (non-canonical NTP hydrolase)
MSNNEMPPYTFNLFQEQAMRTAKEMEPEANLIHAALGLTSEAGEFADAIKKSFAYEKEIDLENLVEEVGDMLWFCALACHALNIPMEIPALRCIGKLYARYPEKFTNEDAIARTDKQETMQ